MSIDRKKDGPEHLGFGDRGSFGYRGAVGRVFLVDRNSLHFDIFKSRILLHGFSGGGRKFFMPELEKAHDNKTFREVPNV